jgi:hypothetical protein
MAQPCGQDGGLPGLFVVMVNAVLPLQTPRDSHFPPPVEL